VTETWDLSQEGGPKAVVKALASRRTKKAMNKTLERIEELVTA
jgi:hypothetical protein